LPGFIEYGIQACLFICPFRKIRIGIGNGYHIPCAHPRVIGLRIINLTLPDAETRVGIVHYRGLLIGTRREIVGKTKGMPDFMGRQLPYPCQGHFKQGWPPVILSCERFVGQGLGDEVILAYPQTPQAYMPFNDLPGTRVGYAAAIAPSPG